MFSSPSSGILLVLVGFVVARAPAGPWDEFNYAPASRTVWPKAIFKTEGPVVSPELLVANAGATTLSAKGAYVSLDFGLEIGGIVSLTFDAVTTNSNVVLAFTESSLFVRPDASDDSTLSARSTRYDLVQNLDLPLRIGRWTQPIETLRGGFRYLTLASTGNDPITISNVSCTINFMPGAPDLRGYTGYFYSEGDELLSKIWYAGAYTVQTNVVPHNTGRVVPFSPVGWRNDAIAGVEGALMVDGAKRDRAVWPGDMGVAVPTAFVSLGDLTSTRNSLDTMLNQIDTNTGELPESGPPLNARGSDTYQAWTLVGVHSYVLYSNDMAWLAGATWDRYKLATEFLVRKIVPETGLMDVTGRPDWALLDRGGQNPEGNALLYRVLTNGAGLADWLNDTATAANYRSRAAALKEAFNTILWDESAGMYRDNANSSMHPQDGNSLAVLYGVTSDAKRAVRVSNALKGNWNELGPVSPEVPDTISPFISSFELQAHFLVGNDDLAMDLLRRHWGYLLTSPIMTQSTFVEGISANGSLFYRANVGYENDPSFTSHAHGWSTGPTSALSFFVLGLQIRGRAGSVWEFAPHTSGLPGAEGGFETSLGWFGAKWHIDDEGSFVAEVTVPEGVTGTVNVEWVKAERTTVVVNGEVVVATSGERSGL